MIGSSQPVVKRQRIDLSDKTASSKFSLSSNRLGLSNCGNTPLKSVEDSLYTASQRELTDEESYEFISYLINLNRPDLIEIFKDLSTSSHSCTKIINLNSIIILKILEILNDLKLDLYSRENWSGRQLLNSFFQPETPVLKCLNILLRFLDSRKNQRNLKFTCLPSKFLHEFLVFAVDLTYSNQVSVQQYRDVVTMGEKEKRLIDKEKLANERFINKSRERNGNSIMQQKSSFAIPDDTDDDEDMTDGQMGTFMNLSEHNNNNNNVSKRKLTMIESQITENIFSKSPNTRSPMNFESDSTTDSFLDSDPEYIFEKAQKYQAKKICILVDKLLCDRVLNMPESRSLFERLVSFFDDFEDIDESRVLKNDVLGMMIDYDSFAGI